MDRGSIRKSWRELAPFLPNRSRLKVAVVGTLSFLGGLAESAVLVLLTLTADALIQGRSVLSLGRLDLPARSAALVALGLVFLRVVMAMVAAVVAARFSAQVMRAAQLRLLTAYLASSHAVRSSRPPGDLSAVVFNHGRYTGDLAASFAAIAAALCGLVAFGGTSVVVNPVATLAIAGLGLVVLALIRPLRHRSRSAARSFEYSARILAQEMTEIEDLHREIEVFHVGAQVAARANRKIRESAGYYIHSRFYSAAIPQLFQAALLASAVVSLLFIIGNVDEASLGAVGAVVLLLIRSMSSAQQLVTASQSALEQTSFAEAVNGLIDEFDRGHLPRGSEAPEHLLPIRLESVSFSYDANAMVLRQLDLELTSGELIGIVGPSGAGKSTLVELLLGLRQPTSGDIRCGDFSLNDIDPLDFASRVAFVPQQPVLVAGTVAENVDLFRGLPEERIRSAIKQAHLEEEIAALPNGIHTLLGPDDRSLSGGQQQRLTIARALAGDPEVVILDEPTSALDPISERAVRQALVELPAGRLVVVVAHRYSTLHSCSRILALSGGELEADATPDEVARHSDFFRRMVEVEP